MPGLSKKDREFLMKIAEKADSAVKKVDEFIASQKPVVVEPKPGRIVSEIDHDMGLAKFRMDVTFSGGDKMSPQERIDKSTLFLEEIETVLDKYGIYKLQGNYINHKLNP